MLFHFWKSWGVGALILFLCLIPSATLPKFGYFELTYSDLIAHTTMFLVFSAVLYWDLSRFYSTAKAASTRWFITLSICLFLGMATEMLQYVFVMLNRTANVYDFLFDCVGAVSGTLGVMLIRRKSGPAA
jgi:VanZ family protein